MEMKKMLVILLGLVLLVSFAVFAHAVECKPNEILNDPNDPNSGCREKTLEDLNLDADNCPGCSIDGDGNLVVPGNLDLTNLVGITVKIIVNPGGKITPPENGIGGPATCEVQNGALVSCNLESGSEIEGQRITGTMTYNGETGEITCTAQGSGCKVDGLTVEPDSVIIFNPSAEPNVIVKKGYVRIAYGDIFTGTIKTDCPPPEERSINGLPVCAVITMMGDYIHSPNPITVLGVNRYRLGPDSIIIQQEPKKYSLVIGKAPTLFGYNLDCGGESGEELEDCIGINLDENKEYYLSARIHNSKVAFAYTQEAPFRSVDYYYSEPLAEFAGLTVIEVIYEAGKLEPTIVGELRFTNELNIVKIPPSMNGGVVITRPDGSSQRFDAQLDEEGKVIGFGCYNCPKVGQVEVQPSAATSFFSSIGRAWGWVTGNGIFGGEEKTETPPPKKTLPPNLNCGPGGRISRGHKIKAGSRFATDPGATISEYEVEVQTPEGPRKYKVYVQKLVLDPPLISAGPPPIYGKPRIVYAVSVQDPAQPVGSGEAIINFFIITESDQPLAPEQFTPQLTSSVAYYQGGGLALEEEIALDNEVLSAYMAADGRIIMYRGISVTQEDMDYVNGYDPAHPDPNHPRQILPESPYNLNEQQTKQYLQLLRKKKIEAETRLAELKKRSPPPQNLRVVGYVYENPQEIPAISMSFGTESRNCIKSCTERCARKGNYQPTCCTAGKPEDVDNWPCYTCCL